MGAVNWVGLWGLAWKEVRRFLAVYVQTVAAPVVTTLLFLAVFSLVLGRALRVVGGVPFLEFLGPGLIMMAMIQNAFANSSSSLISAKMQGNIVDMLMAPLSPGELTAGYGIGGMMRGLLVGVIVGVSMLPFVTFSIHSLGHVLFHALGASLMLSLLGIVGGIWADKHEQAAVLTNFVIAPLAFLSGTFYSIERLPGAWNTIARLDPFFYMIDGFRYGFTGHAEGPLYVGYLVIVAGNLILATLCWVMFKTGYRLRP
jgi:ABC-2 type transport system permease protein